MMKPAAFKDATEQEVDGAMQLAAVAHMQCKQLTRQQRAAFLTAIAEEIQALGDDLLQRAMQETSLPLARLQGERGRTMAQLNMFADLLLDGAYVDKRMHQGASDIRRMLRPLGPVVVFGASNFPLAFSVAGGDTASALAAGCPVVVKAHPGHPGTSELVAQAIHRAVERTGMPEGIFQMLHGQSQVVGQALVSHAATKAVGFTGSFHGGKALFDLAMQRPEPIPVYAEMGSINPVFMLPDAVSHKHKELAQGLGESLLMGVGQFCTNPGLVVALQDAGTEKFMAVLAEQLEQAAAGTMLHAGLAQAYADGVAKLAATAGVTQRAKVAAQGDGTAGPALFSVDAQTFQCNPDLQEEVFGPCCLVVLCANKHELLQVASSLQGQLTATIHGTDQDQQDFVELLPILEEKAGRLLWGGFPTGVEVCTAMQHGGPFPATTDSRSTSVGTAAIQRFLRPVCYQDMPQAMLPAELRDGAESLG